MYLQRWALSLCHFVLKKAVGFGQFVLSKVVLYCIFNLFNLFSSDFLSKNFLFFFNIKNTGSHLVTCDASEFFSPLNPSWNFSAVHLWGHASVHCIWHSSIVKSLSLILGRTFAGQSDCFLYKHPLNNIADTLLLHTAIGMRVKEYLHGHEEPV